MEEEKRHSSAGEALEHAQGKRELRTTALPPPPKPMGPREVRKLRGTLNCSQAVFASTLNVSTKLVQAWEAKRRRPEGPALLLLRLIQKQPALAFSHATKPPVKARKVAEAGAREAAESRPEELEADRACSGPPPGPR